MKKEVRIINGTKATVRYLVGEKVETKKGTILEIAIMTETYPFLVLQSGEKEFFISLATIIDLEILETNIIDIDDSSEAYG